MLIYLLQGITFAVSATVMPGPFQAYLLSRTLAQGWRKTLPAALAPLLTDGPILVLCIGVLTRTPPALLDLLRLAGGAYILYLARGLWAHLAAPSRLPMPDPAAARRSLLQAAGVNLLNPNPYIFWGTVGSPIIVAGWRENPLLGTAFLAGFFVTFPLGLALLIAAFGKTGGIGPKTHRTLGILATAALVFFGIYQFVLGGGRLAGLWD